MRSIRLFIYLLVIVGIRKGENAQYSLSQSKSEVLEVVTKAVISRKLYHLADFPQPAGVIPAPLLSNWR